MKCRIQCGLTTGHLAIDRGELAAAAATLPEIEDLLHRAIECGALIDPWYILGFGGQFSLFPAVENSVHDHRADELIVLGNDFRPLHAAPAGNRGHGRQRPLRPAFRANGVAGPLVGPLRHARGRRS